MGPDRGNTGGVPKLQCSFLQETDKYSLLCEQERYRDGAPMRWLPKGTASCHALILRDAEKSLYRYSRHRSFRIPTPTPNSELNSL